MGELLSVSRSPWAYVPAYGVSGEQCRHAGNYSIVSPGGGGVVLATVWVGKGATFGDLTRMAASPELVSALERLRGAFRGLLAGTPVRDVEETLAEVDHALARATGSRR